MSEKNPKKELDIQIQKGTHDILPDEYAVYQNFYKKADEIAEYYGFQPIQTPHFEKMDLFTAAAGETSDIVEKQIYYLKSKDNNLVLRPEGTAPIIRAYIENGMHTWPQPVMFRYKGSFFRHERPQKGRLRELQQFGLEIIGENTAVAEATIIKVMVLILEELGVGPITVHINSLGDKDCINSYRRELTNFYKKKVNHLCEDCKRRLKENPLRLLDCKEEKCVAIKKEAPQTVDYLCQPCKQHFKDVLEFLDLSEVPYFLDPHLVRGLDYYSRTVFEIFVDKDKEKPAVETKIETPQDQPKQDSPKENSPLLALGGGGRYDSLAKILGGREIPAIGGGFGADRIVQLMIEKGIKPKHDKKGKVFFIQLGTDAKHKSLNIIEMLRKAHIQVAQSLAKDSIKSQLKIASKLEMSYALILGQKEVLEDSIIVRDMDNQAQETVPIDKVVEYIKKKIK